MNLRCGFWPGHPRMAPNRCDRPTVSTGGQPCSPDKKRRPRRGPRSRETGSRVASGASGGTGPRGAAASVRPSKRAKRAGRAILPAPFGTCRSRGLPGRQNWGGPVEGVLAITHVGNGHDARRQCCNARDEYAAKAGILSRRCWGGCDEAHSYPQRENVGGMMQPQRS